MSKSYEELTFADDFMFCKVMVEHPELAKQLAELVTGRKILRISDIHPQMSLREFADGKGVRFDVYFEDDANTAYDFEMQTTLAQNLPRRTRYYQTMLDARALKAGDGYKELCDSYIVFICLTDPFEEGLYRYTFENRCLEVPALSLGDGARKIFLNAGGFRGDVPKEMRDFLEYLASQTPKGDLANHIEDAIRTARDDRAGRRMYMTFQEKLSEERAIGIRIGDGQRLKADYTTVSERLRLRDPSLSEEEAEKQARYLLALEET